MHYVATFVGLLPAEDPDLSILVAVDEPDPSKSIYAGDVAAPAFSELARWALRALDIAPGAGGSVSDVPELSDSAQDGQRRRHPPVGGASPARRTSPVPRRATATPAPTTPAVRTRARRRPGPPTRRGRLGPPPTTGERRAPRRRAHAARDGSARWRRVGGPPSWTATPPPSSPAPATTPGPSAPATCSAASRGRSATATTTPRRRSRPEPPPCSCERPLGLGVAEVRVAVGPLRHRPGGRRGRRRPVVAACR